MDMSEKLMIPGPVEVSKSVLGAMGSPVRPHYGAEWTAFYNDTLAILKKVFNTQADIFLMVGSGTVAIDACLGSAFSTGEKIIVGTNGFFGDRLVSIAQGNGLKVIPVTAEWGQPLRANDFNEAFNSHPDAKGATVVHLETSTAVQNPIDAIGANVRNHGGCFVVDAVSSLGGVPFAMDDWCIDLCASATQKCLGAPPGLAPCAVSKRGWEAIDRNPNKAHGWYCDLRTWRKYATEWGDWHPSPVTMATSNVIALKMALDELMKEGIDTRLKRYRSFALRLREGLRKVGMPPFTPDDALSPVLTAALAPEGTSSLKIVEFLGRVHHIKISPGLGALKEKIFRVGHMSPILTETDIDNVIEGLAGFRKE